MRLRVWNHQGKHVEADLDRLYALDQCCFHPGVAYTRDELGSFLAHPSAFAALVEGRALSGLGRRELLGFSIGRTLRSRGRAVFHIITIDVAPTARRRGVGTRLIEWMTAKASELRVSALRLEVSVDNEEAQGFYQSLGFTQVGRIPGYYPGPKDALVLEKQLAENKIEPKSRLLSSRNKG